MEHPATSTVEALAAKADVKARAQEKAGQLAGRLTARPNKAGEQIRRRPAPAAMSGGVPGAIVVVILLIIQWRRR